MFERLCRHFVQSLNLAKKPNGCASFSYLIVSEDMEQQTLDITPDLLHNYLYGKKRAQGAAGSKGKSGQDYGFTSTNIDDNFTGLFKLFSES